MGVLTTIVISCVVAGIIITVTTPTWAAILMVLGMVAICGAGYLGIKKAGG